MKPKCQSVKSENCCGELAVESVKQIEVGEKWGDFMQILIM